MATEGRRATSCHWKIAHTTEDILTPMDIEAKLVGLRRNFNNNNSKKRT